MRSKTHVVAIIFQVTLTAVFCIVWLRTGPRQYVIFGFYEGLPAHNDLCQGVQP